MAKRRFNGVVVSNKMQKTVVVAVDIHKKHPIYGKTVRNTKRFKARDEIGLNIDDKVIIEECKPHSKEVTWVVVEKLEEKKK